MCLIFIALKQHPEYKLIAAANRDEFYNRKTAAADYWSDHPDILGGKDLEAGGTWLAMTTSGKLSMITNYRDPKNINPGAPSRGHLVSDYLIGKSTPAEYMQQVETNGRHYNGFNLIAGTVDELYYFSNYRNGITRMTTGLFGLSNHLLESPWPKVVRGKEKFLKLLQKEIDKDNLFDLLYDDLIASDTSLPDTGVGLERERVLSSMFIKSPGYGTRCSTVILVDQKNRVSFSERVFDLTSFQYVERNFNFQS